MSRARTSALILGCLWAVAAHGVVYGATLADPALRFRVLATEHFLVYFHQGEDATAARLAAIAEETRQRLLAAQAVTPPRLTHVLLVDQTESANGWATPVPYNTIFIAAAAPAGSEFIGNTDDWLRLVFTHEFTHIVHLDRSEGWARFVRGAFGRLPIAFPNLLLPGWQIEGLATYEESAMTGGGRVHAGDFSAIASEAARAGRFEPLDRVNGGLTDWPGGNAAYAYGVGFHQYLADRFGADRLAALSNQTARSLPFAGSRAFRRIYGESLGTLWKEYRATITQAQGPPPSSAASPVRVTHHGFVVLGPRFDRGDCAGCPATLLYSVRTPDGFPTLNRVALDGTEGRTVTTRYLGSTTAPGQDTIYFDQQEIRRSTGLASDLYALHRASGRVTRVTSDARLLDPDLSPDESTIVATRNTPDRRELVLVRLKQISYRCSADLQVRQPCRPEGLRYAQEGSPHTVPIDTLVSEPGTQFDAPRWSPDGRTVAVSRHRRGSWPELVIVDVQTRAARVLASSSGTRIVTPAWRPDGLAIVASVAREDAVFNLVEFAMDGAGPARQLTWTTGGATWPDVSPDGQTIVFAGYTADGFDVFGMPYGCSAGLQACMAGGPEGPRYANTKSALEPDTTGAAEGTMSGATRYAAWKTMAPTWWSPLIEGDRDQQRVGAMTGGSDVLGYHAYFLSATWLASNADQFPRATAPDWDLSYAYARWRPVWWVSASSTTAFAAGPPTDDGRPSTSTLREREYAAGVAFPIRHVRVSHTAVASIVRGINDVSVAHSTGDPTRSRWTALRAAWATTSAHTYGYSISPESGVTLGATAEVVRSAFGSDADATTFTGDARAYLATGIPHHVLALRLAGGTSSGDRTVERTFLLGGPSPNADVLDFGRHAISLLRGFSTNTFAGNRVALLNMDYRFPIARPQRGLGTWPAFLHTLHGAAFLDAGHAWTRTFSMGDAKTSVGGELSADVVAGYSFRFTAAAGVAWGHDGSGTVPDHTTIYLRVGRAF